MRESIAKLRGMDPDATAYDDTLMELMREVLHHVADEETILLPMAEESLAHDLRRLGARMNTRRAQRPAELAINGAGAFPVHSYVIAAGRGSTGGGFGFARAHARTARFLMKSAFIFDLDGTLIDSVYQHVIAWSEALTSEGLSLPVSRIHRKIGMSSELFVKQLLREVVGRVNTDHVDRIKKDRKWRSTG